ncbi:MAG: phage tail protein [Thalassospira sp.]|uniref:phage tail protein n=1 Tax=Thalassospira sp. 11-3 TaxID=2135614 RepID=UPI000D7592EC|nr:phage tail protein [Thalassospira sp. 11-3]MBL4839929.1 phage tail protein [Thalassospira sp.]PXX30872.1 tail-collar fiber protein [Thalassospira sp. 11-3]
MSDYYTIFTNIGVAKMANALALGQSVVLTHFAVGDGGLDGAYNPTATQTELKNETFRAAVNAINVDVNNPSWLVIEAVIPANQGGWYVREAGLFDQDGDMIAIIRYPETFKPVLESGVGKDLYLRVILEHSNTELVELKVDPAIVLATRQFVGDSIDSHNADENSHPDFLRYNLPRVLEAGFNTEFLDLTITGNTASFDPATRSRFKHTLTDAIVIANPAAIPNAGPAMIKLTQDATGNRAVDWGTKYRVTGEVSYEPNAVSLCHLQYDGADDVIDVVITHRPEA